MLKFTLISVFALAACTLHAQTRQVQGSSATYNSQFKSSGSGSYNHYDSGSRSYSGVSSSSSSSSYGGGSGSYSRSTSGTPAYKDAGSYVSGRPGLYRTTAMDKDYSSASANLAPWSKPEENRVVIVHPEGYVAFSELAQINKYELVPLPKTLEMAPLGATDLGPAKGEYHPGVTVGAPTFPVPLQPLFALPTQTEIQQYSTDNFFNNGVCALTGLRHRCGVYCMNGSYWTSFIHFSCYAYLDMNIQHPKTVAELMAFLRAYYNCVGMRVSPRHVLSTGDLSLYTQRYMGLVQRINR